MTLKTENSKLKQENIKLKTEMKALNGRLSRFKNFYIQIRKTAKG